MRYVAAFMLFFLLNVVLDGIMMGTGGIASTRLTAQITATAVTIPVANASGFLGADYAWIGNEKFRYSSHTATTFTVWQSGGANGRGWDDTTASGHGRGSEVYNEAANIGNAILGFNAASATGDLGTFDLVVWGNLFIFQTLPKLITWRFEHFMVSPWLTYIRIVFVFISAGFVFWIVGQIGGGIIGGLLTFFRR